MKILSKEEKNLEKKEYKDGDFFISDYILNINLKKYEKRANKYLYHYNRLLSKREFLKKRIVNLDFHTIIFLKTEYASVFNTLFNYTEPEIRLEKVFKKLGIVSYDKVIPEIDKFERSVLKFSQLFAITSEILDLFAPDNKDKFEYNKIKDFKFKVKRAFTEVKNIMKNKIR